jgi:hypothetical protein
MRRLRVVRPRRAELTLDRHDLRTRQALVEAEDLLGGLRDGPHQSYGPRGRVLHSLHGAPRTRLGGSQNGMQLLRARPSCCGWRLAAQLPTHLRLRCQPGSAQSYHALPPFRPRQGAQVVGSPSFLVAMPKTSQRFFPPAGMVQSTRIAAGARGEQCENLAELRLFAGVLNLDTEERNG